MIQKKLNANVILVNSVKPMAHTQSSFNHPKDSHIEIQSMNIHLTLTASPNAIHHTSNYNHYFVCCFSQPKTEVNFPLDFSFEKFQTNIQDHNSCGYQRVNTS